MRRDDIDLLSTDAEPAAHGRAVWAPPRAAAPRPPCDERQRAAVLADALEAVRAAAFVCDARGRVLALTLEATAALRRGFLTVREGRLCARSAADDRALEQAVRAIASGGAAQSARHISLILRDPQAPERFAVADVSPAPARTAPCALAPVVVSLRNAVDDRADFHRLMQTAFGLSDAEADVLVRLVGGESRERIAEARQVSIETVRNQVKHLFAKMGVAREGELIARLRPFR
jgi:DNA-binding CsgD family transcriptional regulator